MRRRQLALAHRRPKPLHAPQPTPHEGSAKDRCGSPRDRDVRDQRVRCTISTPSEATSVPRPSAPGNDAQSEQVEATVGVAKRRGGRSASQDSSARNSSPAPTESHTERSPGRPSSQATPQDPQPEGLDIEPLRGGKVFHLDGEM